METGWERLKDLFDQRHGKTIPSEFHTWSVITITGSCVGFMFGGVIGARNAADAHIERTKLIVYDHGFQAQREMHSASIRGFIRMGSRWGWRIGIFASLFSAVNIMLAVYRDRDDFINTTAAGVTGGAFRLSWGLKACLGGAIIGTAVTLPCALVFQIVDRMLVSSVDRENYYNERRNARQQRRLQREQRSQQVDVLLQDMENELGQDKNMHVPVATGLSGYYKREETPSVETVSKLSEGQTARTGVLRWKDSVSQMWKNFRERWGGKPRSD